MILAGAIFFLGDFLTTSDHSLGLGGAGAWLLGGVGSKYEMGSLLLLLTGIGASLDRRGFRSRLLVFLLFCCLSGKLAGERSWGVCCCCCCWSREHQQKIEKFSLCFGKTRFFSVASVAFLASVASVASLSFPNNTTFFRSFPKLP